MKRTFVGSILVLSLGLTLAWPDLGGGRADLGTSVSAGLDLAKAATLSDKDVQSMALQFSKESDRLNPVTNDKKYGERLRKLTAPYKNYDGLNLEFKAYNVVDVNAFALANGSVRVFAGLMDLMNDDELLFVIGHEIGHVKEGHTKEKMRMAYTASAARKGVAASNSTAGTLAASELGGMLQAVLNSQFSQGEEKSADDYGLKFLKANKRDPKAAISAMQKLAKVSKGSHSLLSSHPDPEARAERLAKKI